MVVTIDGKNRPREAQRGGHAAAAGTAPGPLELVRAFVNTLDIEAGTDELVSAAALEGWLSERGLVAGAGAGEVGAGIAARSASAADLRDAIAVREGLRAVLRSHVSLPSARDQLVGAPGRIAELRDIAARLPARIEVTGDGGFGLVPAASGVAGALTGILLIAAEAATAGTWPRLKVCSADGCQWAFYDRSPASSGCWCSMAVCGSRAKARSYRRRAAARG
jgi:predicted RNA-binding Zn ribbon-like protein